MGLFGLLILLLAVAFLLRLDFIFYIVYVCIGIYAISRWYTPRALRRLQISREFNDHAFLGETLPVTLKWRNLSRLPLPWIEFAESIPPELRGGETMRRALALAGRQEAEFTYHINAGRRGYYRLGPLRLATGDLFGLTGKQQGYLDADYLTVYPRIIPLGGAGLSSRLPFGTIASRQRLFEDPARPMGVREYRSGDSMRQINWKVSAHADDLLVRTLEPAISLETAVLLNLHSDDYERRDWRYHTEWAISLAASLAAHLINQRQPVGLITNGLDPLQTREEEEELLFDEHSGRLTAVSRSDEGILLPPHIPPRNGRPHLMKILERLARLESDKTIPFNRWLSNASLGLSWGVTVLAITARGDEATCAALHRLVRSGLNPILFAVEPDYHFEEVHERARRLGFKAFNTPKEHVHDLWSWSQEHQPPL